MGRDEPNDGLECLLQSWKRVHQAMVERGDPDAAILARDIATLERPRGVAQAERPKTPPHHATGKARSS